MKINSYQLSQFSWSQEENLRRMKVHPGQVDFPASQVTFHVHLLHGQGPAISHLLTKWSTKTLHMGEETALGKQNLSPAACSSEIQFFFKPPYNFIHFFGSTRSFSRISCIKRTLRLINHQTINIWTKHLISCILKAIFLFIWTYQYKKKQINAIVTANWQRSMA